MDEKILWVIRDPNYVLGTPMSEAMAQSQEIIFTSERIVLQRLPGGEKTFRVVSKLLFGPILAPPSEAIVGVPKYEIDSKRIVDSINYAGISEVKIDFNYKRSVFSTKIYKVGSIEPYIVFDLEKGKFTPWFDVLYQLLGKKVAPTSIEVIQKLTAPSSDQKLADMTLRDFCGHLVKMGYKAEAADEFGGYGKVGIITCSDCNFDYIKKDTDFGVCNLSFIVNNVKGKNSAQIRMDFKQGKNTVPEVKWNGWDKTFVERLNQDRELIQLIIDAVNSSKNEKWYSLNHWALLIMGMIKKERVKVEYKEFTFQEVVHIDNLALDYLPPGDFFKVMDRIGTHLRSSS